MELKLKDQQNLHDFNSGDDKLVMKTLFVKHIFLEHDL